MGALPWPEPPTPLAKGFRLTITTISIEPATYLIAGLPRRPWIANERKTLTTGLQGRRLYER